jgi:hypothetical protein
MPYGDDPTEPLAAPDAWQRQSPKPAQTIYDPQLGRDVPYVAPVTPLPPPLSVIERYESGGKNLPNYRYDKTHTASGYWQITDTNWRNYGPKLGIDVEKYPTAMSAPREAQQTVAQKMYDEEGYNPWAPYNPALARAIGGGYGKDPAVEGGKWRVEPSAIAAAQARSDGSVWWMTPGEYRAAIEETPSSTKRRSLLKSLMGGDAIADLPELETAKKGGQVKIVGHDGSNRARIAEEELGTDGLIPVFIKGVLRETPPAWIADTHGNERPFNFTPVPKAGSAPSLVSGALGIFGDLPALQKGQSPRSLQQSGDFYSGVRDIAVEGPLQMLAHVLPEVVGKPIIERQRQREADIAQERASAGDTGTDVPRIAGRMVAALPLAAVGGAPTTLARAALAGAVGSAAGAALTPIEEKPGQQFWWEKAKEAGIGAAIGGGLGAGGYGIGQAIAPTFRPQVNAMLKEGIRLTPGQMAGGAARRMEDAFSSVPIVGQAVRAGQRRAIEDFNRAAWNRVLAPLGESLPRSVLPGRDAAQYVDDVIDAAYNRVVPNLVGQADRQFVTDLVQVAQRARSELPTEQRRRFAEIVRSQLLDKVSAPARGDQLKGIDSMLGAEARGYKSDPMHDNRKLGHIIDDLHAAFRATLMRQNPQYAGDLRAANEAYANFVRVGRAASSSGAKEGVFSPAQLRMAVRQSDPSLRKLDFAKGEALMQDLSDAAEATLPRTVPDSGTPERLLTERAMALLAGGGAAYFSPGMLMGGLAATAPYTGIGMNALRGWATAFPAVRNMMAQPFRQGAAVAGPAGTVVGNAGQP